MMLGSQSSFLLVYSKAVNRSERARSLDSAYAWSHLVPPTTNKYEDCGLVKLGSTPSNGLIRSGATQSSYLLV